MKLNLLLASWLVFSAVISAFSQGYIVSDTSYSQGYNLEQTIFRNNREVKFSRSKRQPSTTYLPKDLKEYGFDARDVYVKRIISDGAGSSPYFLHRVVNGEVKLYEFKTEKKPRYFVERDSTLVEVTKSALTGQLSGILKPCDSFESSIAQARYTRGSLMRIVSLNNSCDKGLFPTLKKGILFGYSNSSLTLGNTVDNSFFVTSSASPLVGAFIDFPLGLKPSWFINFQAYFQQDNFKGFEASSDQDLNYSLQRSTVNFPLQLKYRGRGINWRPFMSLGPTTSYAIRQQAYWVKSEKQGTQVATILGSMDAIGRMQIRPTLSAGVELSLTRKISASLELRYSRFIHANAGEGQTFGLISSFYF